MGSEVLVQLGCSPLEVTLACEVGDRILIITLHPPVSGLLPLTCEAPDPCDLLRLASWGLQVLTDTDLRLLITGLVEASRGQGEVQ